MRKDVFIGLFFCLLVCTTHAEVVYTFPGGMTGWADSGIRETLSLPPKLPFDDKDLIAVFHLSSGYFTGWSYGFMFGCDVNEDGHLGIEEVALEFYPAGHLYRYSSVALRHFVEGAESCDTWCTVYFDSDRFIFYLTIPRSVFRPPVPGDPGWSLFRAWDSYYQIYVNDPFHPSQWNMIRIFEWNFWVPPLSVTIGWYD